MTVSPDMDPDIPNQFVKRTSARDVVMFFLALAGVMVLLAIVVRRHVGTVITRGTRAPQIRADGWLNGDAPTEQSLAGRVVLIDVWAPWCQPCRQEAPHLVELHRRFKDRGVVFIGLTSDGRSRLPQIEQFLRSAGITWLNGWGATETLTELGAEYIPHNYVIGPDGRLIWDSSKRGHVESALEQALNLVDPPKGG